MEQYNYLARTEEGRAPGEADIALRILQQWKKKSLVDYVKGVDQFANHTEMSVEEQRLLAGAIGEVFATRFKDAMAGGVIAYGEDMDLDHKVVGVYDPVFNILHNITHRIEGNRTPVMRETLSVTPATMQATLSDLQSEINLAVLQARTAERPRGALDLIRREHADPARMGRAS